MAVAVVLLLVQQILKLLPVVMVAVAVAVALDLLSVVLVVLD